MIPLDAGPTSPKPKYCSGGNRKFRSVRGCNGRSNTSALASTTRPPEPTEPPNSVIPQRTGSPASLLAAAGCGGICFWLQRCPTHHQPIVIPQRSGGICLWLQRCPTRDLPIVI